MSYKEIMKEVVSKDQAARIMLTFKSKADPKQNGGNYLNGMQFQQALSASFAVHGINVNNITSNTADAVITRLERKSGIEF
jgi:hypothetical protein